MSLIRIVLRHAVLLWVLAFPVAPAWGADIDDPNSREVDPIEADHTLSLHDVVQRTLERDPRQNFSSYHARQGEALRDQAAKPYSSRPALNLRHQTDAIGNARGLREYEASVELPLWRPAQREATRHLAQRTGDYAASQSRALQLTVAGLVRDVLWQLLLAEERLKLAQQAWETAKALEREVGIRVKAGDLAEKDGLLARDESLSKEDEYNAMRMELNHAAERYESLSGLSERPASFTEIQSRQREIAPEHPLLSETQQRITRSRAQTERLRSSRGEVTHLVLGVRNEKAATGESSQQSVGVGIRIPLDTNRFQAADLAVAELNVSEVEAEQILQLRQLELVLHEAGHELQAVREALELAKEQSRVVHENHRLAHNAFKAGELDLAQYLRAQSRALAAERQLSLRLIQEQQAIARYNQAAGDIP